MLKDFLQFINESEDFSTDQIKRLRQLGIDQVDLDIEFDDSFEDSTADELAKANNWFGENGEYVISGDGKVTDYISDFTLTLSNGTMIGIDAYYSNNPTSDKTRAILTILSPNGSQKRYKLRAQSPDIMNGESDHDEWNEALSNYGSIIKAALLLYEKYKGQPEIR